MNQLATAHLLDPTRLDLATDPTKRMLSGRTVHGGIDFEVPYMTEIVPGLWQGGCTNGLVLPEEIRHVVSLYPWESYTIQHEIASFLSVFLYDSPDQDPRIFDDIATWAIAARSSGPVLVHCQAGLNRSSVVTAIVLMRSEGLTGREAVDLIREKRSPACLCNESFESFVLNGGVR